VPIIDFRDSWRDGCRVSWADGDRTVQGVLVGTDDEADLPYVLTIGGAEHFVDDETDLLDLVPPGTVVTFSRAGISVAMWLAGGRAHARASTASGVDGPTATGSFPGHAVEEALRLLGERAQPPLCFFCAHSDYEVGGSWGGQHLACLVDDPGYDAMARSDDAYTRKWAVARAHRSRWVDELDGCASWRRRPPGYGYRG